jgi:hypothetical protein
MNHEKAVAATVIKWALRVVGHIQAKRLKPMIIKCTKDRNISRSLSNESKNSKVKSKNISMNIGNPKT